MKKTACILTYYRTNSFGAKLQACALYQHLLRLNIQPVMLDIRGILQKPFPVVPYKVHHWQHCIRLFFSELFCRKYMPDRTEKIFHPVELGSPSWKYDFYIVGSDQVWNPALNRAFCNVFFFDFVQDAAVKLSYAASFGTDDLTQWSERQIADARRLLRSFSAVSVREKQGVRICKEQFGVNATAVCDPTFLMGRDFFCSMLPHPETKSGGGVVCFMLTEIDDEVKNILQELVKDYGPGRCIAGGRRGQRIRGMRKSPVYSVQKWLQCMYSADFIVTNSFHGTVFAIMFHKPFLVVNGCKAQMGRITELLDYFHFSDRLYDPAVAGTGNEKWKAPMDFSETELQIAILRKTGVDFLNHALEIEKSE